MPTHQTYHKQQLHIHCLSMTLMARVWRLEIIKFSVTIVVLSIIIYLPWKKSRILPFVALCLINWLAFCSFKPVNNVWDSQTWVLLAHTRIRRYFNMKLLFGCTIFCVWLFGQVICFAVSTLKEVTTICKRRGGNDNWKLPHHEWLQTVQSEPDVISMSFIPITSLLNGVPGSGFLSHAINLYLRCKFVFL